LESPDSRRIQPRIDQQGTTIVLLEGVGELVIPIEKKACRSHASGVELNAGEVKPGGNERGGSIQIGDVVRIAG